MVITVRYYNNIILDFVNLLSFSLLSHYNIINDYDERIYNSFDEIENYNKIYYIDCSDNNLIKLPKLPTNIRTLICENNKLEYLPELPDSLIVLWCCFNPLKKLPKLPNSILEISAYNTDLCVLPEIPDSLIELTVDETKLITQYKYLKKFIY